jgi:hypothetical protein
MAAFSAIFSFGAPAFLGVPLALEAARWYY